MTHRAPGPDAISGVSADGKATASPPSALVPRGRLTIPGPIGFGAQIMGTDTGAFMIVAQWTQLPKPGALLVTGPTKGASDYAKDLAAVLYHFSAAIARGDVLELKRESDTQETAADHVANARQLVGPMIAAAHHQLEVLRGEPDNTRSLMLEGVTATLEYLEAVEQRLAKAAELLKLPDIAPVSLGQPVEIKNPGAPPAKRGPVQ